MKGCCEASNRFTENHEAGGKECDGRLIFGRSGLARMIFLALIQFALASALSGLRLGFVGLPHGAFLLMRTVRDMERLTANGGMK